jgi:hypothetical protein
MREFVKKQYEDIEDCQLFQDIRKETAKQIFEKLERNSFIIIRNRNGCYTRFKNKWVKG